MCCRRKSSRSLKADRVRRGRDDFCRGPSAGFRHICSRVEISYNDDCWSCPTRGREAVPALRRSNGEVNSAGTASSSDVSGVRKAVVGRTVCKSDGMLSPQSLSEDDRRLVAAWAPDCTERVLPLFEAEAPDDGRPRDGIARARAFSRGELDAAGEIRRRFVAGRAAQSATSPAGRAAAWSAGQAAGVAHMGAHSLGAAAYAAKAAELAPPKRGEAEVLW